MHLHFLFHSSSLLLAQIILLKPHNYPPSFCVSFFLFFLLSPSTHARPGFYVFCNCAAFIQTLWYSRLLCCCSFPLHSSLQFFSQPTYEVIAHSQVVVPHRDLQGFLCQLVQGNFIWKLLCRWCTQEDIYINDSLTWELKGTEYVI